MKKAFLTILLVISMLSFYSCDDGGLPTVSEQEAAEALGYSMTAYVTAAFTLGFGGTLDGVTLSADGSTLTFTAYDISDIADPYTTMSGTIGTDATTGNVIYNISFTGGPVVTIYMEITSTEAIALEVNGHDMLNDVTVTVTP